MENIIKEDNRIKHSVCENCKKQLKSVLSDKELQMFENTFYKVARDYVFKEKEN